MTSGQLAELPNIDSELAAWLIDAGFDTPEALSDAGAIGTYMACVEHHEERADLDVLFRLEGAIRGVEWETIPEIDRRAMQADVETALDMAEL